MKQLLLAAALSCLIAAPARADLPAARAAYEAGEWAEAERLAAEEDSAEALAFAARSVISALIMDTVEDREAAARRARDLAERAVERDPENAEAQIQLGMAIGYVGRYTSKVGSFMRGLPRQAKAAFEAARDLRPDDPVPEALLGSWNMEVTRRGGARAFGSSIEQGFAHYETALAEAGEDPVIPYLYALALVAADPDAYGETARDALERSEAGEPEDRFERGVIEKANELRETLQADPGAAQRMAVSRLED